MFVNFSFLFSQNTSFSFHPIKTYLQVHAGKGVGFCDGYETLGLFCTPYSTGMTTFFPFIDARIHFLDENGQLSSNLGIGLRYFDPSMEKMIGMNVFYDNRQTTCLYQQWGTGIEIFTRQFQMTVNGYIPFGNRTSFQKPATFHYPGGYYITFMEQRKALGGIDADVKRNFLRLMDPYGNKVDFYAGLGPYYFHQHCAKSIIGGRLRFGIKITDLLKIEGQTTYDSIFGHTLQGVLSINFALPMTPILSHSKEINFWKSLFNNPVQRQEIIVQSKGSCYVWDANF